jgi:hypothetical protein
LEAKERNILLNTAHFIKLYASKAPRFRMRDVIHQFFKASRWEMLNMQKLGTKSCEYAVYRSSFLFALSMQRETA